MMAGKTVFLAIIVSTMARAQPPQAAASPSSFEVASVKANHSGERIMLFEPGRGGRFTATNCSLNLLIQYAFQVKRYQISGGPAWVKSDGYDIAAKAEGDPEIRYMPGMVQRLLEDRFQLKYHWETQEGTGYDLFVSKLGKLRESDPGDCPSFLTAPDSRPHEPPDPPCGYLPNTPGHTSGRKLTSANLADALAFFPEAFVVDKTNLTGKYDIDLRWTPESVQMRSPAPPVETTGPSIFTALRE
jgi:uncharacterized protein (TIGR03435 family)